jgi:hypothetical protein
METTLFDGRGHPVAYIAEDDDNSIYLWSGHAVAYVLGENVFGWNGRHLGWFVEGVMYDSRGRRVGSVGARCPYATHSEPMKYVKYAKYAKYARHVAYARPAFSLSYAEEPLDEFLKQGAVGSV